jgi:hypothetical protein
MRTGRLRISRGHQEAVRETPPPLMLVPAEPSPAPSSPPATPDYQIVHDRLTALERLTRLFELGALSAAEFASEKALILAMPTDELLLTAPAPVGFVPAAPRAPARGPSLLGRMLHWKLLAFSVVVGLALSWFVQPSETRHLFLHLLGN